MRSRTGFSWIIALGGLALACNAVLGLDPLEQEPSNDGGGAEAGSTGSGGSAGSGTSKGGSSGASGSAGESGGGTGGDGGDGDCTPDEEATCREVDPTLLGNCARGTITCNANGTWGACSVAAENGDSCALEGDDADCDGSPNGGCPCLSGDTRPCGPDSDDGICEIGVQTCRNEVWGTCVGAVLPEPRDCASADDNDCDGQPDNVRDDECPCATDGEHACVETAPADWSGPMAIATGPGASGAPSCAATGYERQVLSLFGVIDEGDTTCNCACSTPSGTCGSAIGMHATSTQAACNMAGLFIGDPVEYTVNVGACTGTVPTGYYKPVAPSFTAGGPCTTQRTANIETPAWTRRMVACETNDSDPAGCPASALCMPELVNPLSAWCIHRTGEQACPSGPYSQQTIYYETFSDGRSCTNCSCGAPTGTCTGSMHFSYGAVQAPGCSRSFLYDSANYGGCMYFDGSTSSPVASPTTPMATGSCTPSGGALQGSVTKSGAVTVCCKP